MASTPAPKGYSPTQIFLHWLIAGLVIFQTFAGESIVPAYRAFRRNEVPTDADMLEANIYVYVGIAVFVLAAWRLALRFMRGVPAAPEGESAIAKWIGIATHLVLYAVIFGMPITGGIAWFMGIREFGEIHEIGKPVIIVAVGLHILGALVQHFVVKSDVLVRMLKPEPSARA